MRFRKPHRLGTVAIGGLIVLALHTAASAAFAADPFYSNLRREGTLAYDRGEYPRAIQLFRLACFGLLEEPVVLSDCLVRLAVAQAMVDDSEAFIATFRRIVEIEQRFGAYSQATLAPGMRQAFEASLERWISYEELQSIAAFRGVARRLVATSGADPSATEQTEEAAEEMAEEAADAPAERPAEPPAAVVAELDAARQLLRAREFSRDQVKEAYPRVRQVADEYPGDVASQHLAGEFAYRLGLWEDGVRYLRRGGEIGADQPLLLFYFAVVLYETGELDAAARALEQCLPALQHNEVVKRYREKILGEGNP